MRAALWVSIQAAVVLWWLWMDWDRATVMGSTFNPGLALALGCFLALIVTAGIARLLDARRFGWKASEPPPIPRADRVAGNLFIVRIIAWPMSLFLFATGALRFTGETSAARMGEGIALIFISVAIVCALKLTGDRLTQRSSSLSRNIDTGGPVVSLPSTNSRRGQPPGQV